jgi:hypothetical protein
MDGLPGGTGAPGGGAGLGPGFQLTGGACGGPIDVRPALAWRGAEHWSQYCESAGLTA